MSEQSYATFTLAVEILSDTTSKTTGSHSFPMEIRGPHANGSETDYHFFLVVT